MRRTVSGLKGVHDPVKTILISTIIYYFYHIEIYGLQLALLIGI